VTIVTRARAGASENASSPRHVPLHVTYTVKPMRESDPRIEVLWRNLATVIDPEIGLDIVTLGLVYGVQVTDDVAVITHTLTTPGCPMERIITDGIRAAVMQTEGICGVETHIVWEPAWHSGMIAPDAW
jgi:metal-sulfur cluster biosynthetic enzyme